LVDAAFICRRCVLLGTFSLDLGPKCTKGEPECVILYTEKTMLNAC